MDADFNGIVRCYGQLKPNTTNVLTGNKKLLDDLKEKRSKGYLQQQDNASILNLVEAWKEQETREKC